MLPPRLESTKLARLVAELAPVQVKTRIILSGLMEWMTG
uniref:Uncharacterized protein n=1 Tax=Rhizophora mucronata TaxID=61149 RepID=A0A2P2NFT3_RHIMU